MTVVPVVVVVAVVVVVLDVLLSFEASSSSATMVGSNTCNCICYARAHRVSYLRDTGVLPVDIPDP